MATVTPSDSAPIKMRDTLELHPVAYYAQKIAPKLPREVFEPYRFRIVWAFGFWSVALASLLLIAKFPELYEGLPTIAVWSIKAVLAVIVGQCFGALGFFAHECLHGSVVRSRTWQDIFGFAGFITWLISPTFWRVWHNQLHHGKTQSLISDPDAFPTLKIFKHSKFMQFMYPFTPGSGYKRSYAYFFFWFSFHVLVAQTYLRFRNSLFENMNHRRANYEFVGQLAIVLASLVWLGPSQLVFTFCIPFVVQNYFMMSYIATNHNLNPLTRVNDPLVNSLTVTNWKWMEPLHLNFGYHVEHHIFPSVNGVYAPLIHGVLKKDFSDMFLVLPKFSAMQKLYQSGRIYKNATTLINPLSGATVDTIRSKHAADMALKAKDTEIPNLASP